MKRERPDITPEELDQMIGGSPDTRPEWKPSGKFWWGTHRSSEKIDKLLRKCDIVYCWSDACIDPTPEATSAKENSELPDWCMYRWAKDYGRPFDDDGSDGWAFTERGLLKNGKCWDYPKREQLKYQYRQHGIRNILRMWWLRLRRHGYVYEYKNEQPVWVDISGTKRVGDIDKVKADKIYEWDYYQMNDYGKIWAFNPKKIERPDIPPESEESKYLRNLDFDGIYAHISVYDFGAEEQIDVVVYVEKKDLVIGNTRLAFFEDLFIHRKNWYSSLRLPAKFEYNDYGVTWAFTKEGIDGVRRSFMPDDLPF